MSIEEELDYTAYFMEKQANPVIRQMLSTLGKNLLTAGKAYGSKGIKGGLNGIKGGYNWLKGTRFAQWPGWKKPITLPKNIGSNTLAFLNKHKGLAWKVPVGVATGTWVYSAGKDIYDSSTRGWAGDRATKKYRQNAPAKSGYMMANMDRNKEVPDYMQVYQS